MDEINSIIDHWQSFNTSNTVNKNSLQIKHADDDLKIYTLYFDTNEGKKVRIKAMPDLIHGWKIITMK